MAAKKILKFTDFMRYMQLEYTGDNSPSFGKLLADAITVHEAPASYNDFQNELSVALATSEGDDKNVDFEVGSLLSEEYEDEIVMVEELEYKKTVVSETIIESSNKTFLVGDDELVNEVCSVLNLLVSDVCSKVETGTPKLKNEIRPPCNCSAKKCSLDDHVRAQLHDEFWKMDVHPRKMWLANHVNFVQPKRRYVTQNPDEERRRKDSREYFLPIDGQKTIVCQKMFLATLGYSSDKVIRNLRKTTNEFSVVAVDQRAKRPPHNKLSEQDSRFITDHINKYNPCISHYRREHAPKRLYLPSELDVSEMYDDYKLACVWACGVVVSMFVFHRSDRGSNPGRGGELS